MFGILPGLLPWCLKDDEVPFDKVLQKRTSLVAAAPARRLSSTDGLLLQVQGLLLSSFFLSSPFSLSLHWSSSSTTSFSLLCFVSRHRTRLVLPLRNASLAARAFFSSPLVSFFLLVLASSPCRWLFPPTRRNGEKRNSQPCTWKHYIRWAMR